MATQHTRQQYNQQEQDPTDSQLIQSQDKQQYEEVDEQQQQQQHEEHRPAANPRSNQGLQESQVQQQESGDLIVTIEVCEKCHQHAWNTQHDEAKYNALFEQIKAQLLEHPEHKFNVLRNVNPSKPSVQIQPRRGAFEIALNGATVYSKIKSTLFPAPSQISDRISKFIQDKNQNVDLSKYENSKEKKMQPPAKPRDKATIYGKYYVAIQEEQERQARLREEQELARIEHERQEEENRRIQQEEAERAQREKEEEEERQRLQEEEEAAQLLREQEAEEQRLKKLKEEEEEERQRNEELKQYQEADAAEGQQQDQQAGGHHQENPQH